MTDLSYLDLRIRVIDPLVGSGYLNSQLWIALGFYAIMNNRISLYQWIDVRNRPETRYFSENSTDNSRRVHDKLINLYKARFGKWP